MSVRDWFAAGLQLVTNQLSAMKLDQLKRFRRLLYSWFKFTRTGQVKVSYQATSIQKPVLDCLCPLRDCLLFTKDRLILVSIILAAAKTCGFSAGLVTGRSLVPKEQGILLTVGKNPGLQPDTASYCGCINCSSQQCRQISSNHDEVPRGPATPAYCAIHHEINMS